MIPLVLFVYIIKMNGKGLYLQGKCDLIIRGIRRGDVHSSIYGMRNGLMILFFTRHKTASTSTKKHKCLENFVTNLLPPYIDIYAKCEFAQSFFFKRLGVGCMFF